MIHKSIYVTEPAMPPLEEFIPYLQKIWESKILTNGGPFHQQLEAALFRFLRTPQSLWSRRCKPYGSPVK